MKNNKTINTICAGGIVINDKNEEIIINDLKIDGKRVDDRTKVDLKIVHSNNKQINLDLEFY